MAEKDGSSSEDEKASGHKFFHPDMKQLLKSKQAYTEFVDTLKSSTKRLDCDEINTVVNRVFFGGEGGSTGNCKHNCTVD